MHDDGNTLTSTEWGGEGGREAEKGNANDTQRDSEPFFKKKGFFWNESRDSKTNFFCLCENVCAMVIS